MRGLPDFDMSIGLCGWAGKVRYRTEVDGMRAVAVVPVVLWHAGFSAVPGGFVGVDVFFVISGFLIAGILYAEITDGRFSILRFYERRARRILPALFLVIAATYPFAWAWMLPGAFADYSRSILAATFFVSNIFFWVTSNYFGPGDGEMPLVHTWSLSVEEQFYIVFPILLFFLWRLAPRRVLPALVAAGLVSLGLSEWLADRASEANFFLAPTRAFELLAGAVAAIWCHGHPSAPVTAKGQALSAAGLAMMLAAIFLYSSATPIPSVYALLPVMRLTVSGLQNIPLPLREAAWALAITFIVGLGLHLNATLQILGVEAASAFEPLQWAGGLVLLVGGGIALSQAVPSLWMAQWLGGVCGVAGVSVYGWHVWTRESLRLRALWGA